MTPIVTLDQERWNQIDALPVPSGVGDLKQGLCCVARIVYAATGRVSAQGECVPATIRSFMFRLNDSTLFADHRDLLSTREIAERVLAADSSRAFEEKRRWIFADHAARVFAPIWLGALGREADARTSLALAPVTDRASALTARDALLEIRAIGDDFYAYAHPYASCAPYADAADAFAAVYADLGYAAADAFAAAYADNADAADADLGYAAAYAADVGYASRPAREKVYASHGDLLRRAALRCLDAALGARA